MRSSGSSSISSFVTVRPAVGECVRNRSTLRESSRRPSAARRPPRSVRASLTELERLASAPATSAYVDSLRERRPRRVARRSALRRRDPSSCPSRSGAFAVGALRHVTQLRNGDRSCTRRRARARARLRARDRGRRSRPRRRRHRAGARDSTRVRRPMRPALDGGCRRRRAAGRPVAANARPTRRRRARCARPGAPSGDAAALEGSLRVLVEHARSLQVMPKFEAAARDLDRRVAARRRGCDRGFRQSRSAGLPATGKKTPELEAFAVFRKTLGGTTNDEKGRRIARAFRIRHRFADHAAVVRDVLGAAEVEIEAASRASASIGFGEVLRAARELLRDRPDVADEVGAGIDALLVDEFQDTSRVQRDLLQLLWARTGRARGGTRPSARGDPGRRTARRRRPQAVDLRFSWCRRRRLRRARGRSRRRTGARSARHPCRRHVGAARAARRLLRAPTQPAKRPGDSRVRERLQRTTVSSGRSAARSSSRSSTSRRRRILLVPPERADAAPTGRTRSCERPGFAFDPKGPSSTRLEEALVIAERIRRIPCRRIVRVGTRARVPPDGATSPSWRPRTACSMRLLSPSRKPTIPYVVAGKSFFRTREVRDLAAMLALVLDPTDRLAMPRGPSRTMGRCPRRDAPRSRPGWRGPCSAAPLARPRRSPSSFMSRIVSTRRHLRRSSPSSRVARVVSARARSFARPSVHGRSTRSLPRFLAESSVSRTFASSSRSPIATTTLEPSGSGSTMRPSRSSPNRRLRLFRRTTTPCGCSRCMRARGWTFQSCSCPRSGQRFRVPRRVPLASRSAPVTMPNVIAVRAADETRARSSSRPPLRGAMRRRVDASGRSGSDSRMSPSRGPRMRMFLVGGRDPRRHRRSRAPRLSLFSRTRRRPAHARDCCSSPSTTSRFRRPVVRASTTPQSLHR